MGSLADAIARHAWEVTNLRIEIEMEEDGRWIAEVPDLPGALAYGRTRDQAVANAKAFALRVMAERLEHGESVPEMTGVFSVVQ